MKCPAKMNPGMVLPLLIAIGVYASDQLTKRLVQGNMDLLEVRVLNSFFNLVYYRNIGSAFGMFRSLGNTFFVIVSGIAIVVVGVLLLKDRENRLGLSFILGGAAGNLTDRVAHGYVIDFLEVHAGGHYWPAFNIADSALTIGMVLLIINAWLQWKGPSCKNTG